MYHAPGKNQIKKGGRNFRFREGPPGHSHGKNLEKGQYFIEKQPNIG